MTAVFRAYDVFVRCARGEIMLYYIPKMTERGVP